MSSVNISTSGTGCAYQTPAMGTAFGTADWARRRKANTRCGSSGGTDHVVMIYLLIRLVHSGHSMINRLKDKDQKPRPKQAAHQLYGKLWLSASCDWSL